MQLSSIEKCSPEEYKYYREERCERFDIIEGNIYVAMFCSHAVRSAFKCDVRVSNVRDDRYHKADGRYVVDIKAEEAEHSRPAIFTVNNLMNGWFEGGGRMVRDDYTTILQEGFLRQ